ncbi:MAG: hypothetical protein F6K10_16045 [Moorea sp. SIO2B7]|nr:hypothetical protein [Moorena sp. SIO2B7]
MSNLRSWLGQKSPEEIEHFLGELPRLCEGEITLPRFVEALALGESSGVFRANGERADVTKTPIPRYDLPKNLGNRAPSLQDGFFLFATEGSFGASMY